MKRVLFLLVAVSAVMTSACRNTETDTLPSTAASTEAGVRIIIKGGERTAVPNVSGLYYTLDLTAADKEPVLDVITESESSKMVNLAPGVWNLDVEGYLCAGDAADELILPVVRGNVANITVTGGEMTNITVQLEAASPAIGSGTLTYEVYFPASVDSAELTLTPYVGGEESLYKLTTASAGEGAKGTVELDAGYYRIAIALNGNDGKQVRQRDIVHIADKLETPVSYSYTESDFAEPGTEDEDDDEPVSIGVNILSAAGWLNAASITWDTLSLAESYEVSYKNSSDVAYTKVDAPLIRNYGTYYRADVMGIASGSYDIKVRPILQDAVEGIIAVDEQRTVSVLSHDRSGYAFNGGKVPGGYKMDGTPKSNARIIYVTDQNKDTITLGVNVDGKGDVTQTGVQKILDGHKKGNETRPLIIRLIGQVKTGAWTDSYAGDMMFETKNAANTYITIEGIGEDATADGWGVRMKNASNIEISNIGFMNTAADEGDDVGLQQKNYYIWVHNCDLFYGKAGGDSDQAKGDGAMDSKGSTYVTFSYNHFWDNGKTHLIGNKENGPDGGPGLLTLHHNWYDHSDSRHPRVRIHTVHVYNNYYDGVAKYGIGVTYGASVFAEGNYFRGTKKPMLISMQGSDVWDAASGTNKSANGTFSSEDGGITKAYGNYFEGSPSGFRFVPYGESGYPNSTVDFDAYVVPNRADTVPDTVKTSQGGHTYNNFDTETGFYSYTADTAEAAKAKVIGFAGRMGGGDFRWTFTTTDDASYAVNTPLQSALVNYQTSLVSVQGEGGSSGDGGGGDDDGDDGGGGEGGGTITCHFTSGKGAIVSSVSGFFTVAGDYGSNKGTVTLNGTDYTVPVKMSSKGNVGFTITQSRTLVLYFSPTQDGSGKSIYISDTSTSEKVSHAIPSNAILSISLGAGSYSITKNSGESNLFYISLSE